MPTQVCLAYMELSGMGFNHNKANRLWELMETKMHALERKAFEIAERRFNLSSKKALDNVKKILDMSTYPETQHHFLKIIHNWRKLNSLKTRNLGPLLLHPRDRYHGICYTTVTGRVMMHKPNIQHIPRDFRVDDDMFSLRSSFVPRKGCVFVSADFCQLELRILAHFSQDPILISSFLRGEDVFVEISANWNKIDGENVTEEIRHQTKQLCYGIIYGMGDIALGEAMGIETTEASLLAARFKECYPGLQVFIDKCVNECRKTGLVRTLGGRIRYLPDINSQSKAKRSHAERQAVNSTIQGSAADIAKKAMVETEKELEKVFPSRSHVIGDNLTSNLVLQLHDELIYEVDEESANDIIKIIQKVMESSTKLSVPLPVKIKQGPTWGELKKV